MRKDVHQVVANILRELARIRDLKNDEERVSPRGGSYYNLALLRLCHDQDWYNEKWNSHNRFA